MSSAVASSNGTKPLREEHPADCLDRAVLRTRREEGRGRAGVAADQEQARERQQRHQRTGEPAGKPGLARTGATCVRPEQHDHEHEQHHDGAGVDDQLDGREELRVQLEEQAGDAEDGPEQPDRAADRVLREHGDERADEAHEAAHCEKEVSRVHMTSVRVCDFAPFRM